MFCAEIILWKISREENLLWKIRILAALLAFIIFVALPAIAMVIVGVCILGAIVSLVGRGRVLAWLTRHLYGR